MYNLYECVDQSSLKIKPCTRNTHVGGTEALEDETPLKSVVRINVLSPIELIFLKEIFFDVISFSKI